MNKVSSKILSVVLSLVTVLSMSLYPIIASAASMSSVSATMSTQATSAKADHTFAWTQSSGHAYIAGDTITIASATSGNFTSAGSWAVTDFQLTMAGTVASSTNPVAVASSSPSCSSGAGNYTVTYTNSTTPSFVITLCSSFGTATTGGTVSFLIKGASGTGTLTNKSSAVSSAQWNITDSGSNTDTGILANVIADNDVVTVSATVNPTLTFTISSSSVPLGTLSSGSTNSATTVLSAASNAGGGFAITYNGPTLTSGVNTIPAYASLSSSVVGTAGFGINLKANTTPSVGADPVGTGCGVATNYNSANSYTWVSNTPTTITNVAGPASCTYTVSYIANISGVTPAGSYSSATTYVATGTF